MKYIKKQADPFERKISLEEAIKEYDKSFEARFEGALSSCMENAEDALYLLGPSSYLFSLSGEKIAVDPQVRRASDLAKVKDKILVYFSKLSAVLITHEHDDHFCTPLANLLKDTDLIWYLPKGMRQKWVEESGLRPECIRFVCAGDSFSVGAVTVKVFDSPHKPFGADWEMVERGYELITDEGRILLPGDIREYAYTDYPPMQNADLCIAHVWAGNNSIAPEEYLPKMESCADFFARFGAKNYFFGHLYEIGREQHVMWDTEHAEILSKMIKKRLPKSQTATPILGCGYHLFSYEEIR